MELSCYFRENSGNSLNLLSQDQSTNWNAQMRILEQSITAMIFRIPLRLTARQNNTLAEL